MIGSHLTEIILFLSNSYAWKFVLLHIQAEQLFWSMCVCVKLPMQTLGSGTGSFTSQGSLASSPPHAPISLISLQPCNKTTPAGFLSVTHVLAPPQNKTIPRILQAKSASDNGVKSATHPP